MTKRFDDALLITNPGACNPSGICHSILEACAEIRAVGGGTKAMTDDPAVRLMVYQLSYICGCGVMPSEDYIELVDACIEKAK